MWIVSDALDIDIECIYVCMYQIFDFDYSDSDMVEINCRDSYTYYASSI